MTTTPPAVKRVLLGLQVVPLLTLVALALAFLIDNPARGVLVWLNDTYRITKPVYPAFMLVCAAIYAGSILRLYRRHAFGVLSAAAYGLVSVPLGMYAIGVWYVQTYIYPGGPIITPLVWLLLAWAMVTIHAFNISFNLWLWEVQQRGRLNQHADITTD